jgi:serine O-acetyltransferase
VSNQAVPRGANIPPLPRGESNENPSGLSLLELLAEDFQTYDRSLMEPGFWAVAVHRFGNWRMGLKKPLRAPCTVMYRTMQTAVHWGWGIKLDYTVKLGRRVRIWHHGGMVLGARSIGDDVHIRQNTTFGVAHRSEPNAKPEIGDRVDVGCGAVILGQIRVEHDSVVGANAVVTHDVPAFSLVAGVPARVVKTFGRTETSHRPAPLVSDVAPRRQPGESLSPELPAAAGGATRRWRARA